MTFKTQIENLMQKTKFWESFYAIKFKIIKFTPIFYLVSFGKTLDNPPNLKFKRGIVKRVGGWQNINQFLLWKHLKRWMRRYWNISITWVSISISS